MKSAPAQPVAAKADEPEKKPAVMTRGARGGYAESEDVGGGARRDDQRPTRRRAQRIKRPSRRSMRRNPRSLSLHTSMLTAKGPASSFNSGWRAARRCARAARFLEASITTRPAQRGAEAPYEAINYHRFADDVVIAVSGHHTNRGWAERALQRLQKQFALLGVELNQEKTKVVDALKGEAFGFLGFDLRRVRKRNGEGYFVLMTPKKKARVSVKAKVRDIVRRGGATPMPELMKRINATVGGWVNYFRVGNSSRAFSEVRDPQHCREWKVRTLHAGGSLAAKVECGMAAVRVTNISTMYWDFTGTGKSSHCPDLESLS